MTSQLSAVGDLCVGGVSAARLNGWWRHRWNPPRIYMGGLWGLVGFEVLTAVTTKMAVFMQSAHFSPIVTKIVMSGQILMKLPNTRWHENMFNGSWAVTCGLTDRQTRWSEQAYFSNFMAFVPKNKQVRFQVLKAASVKMTAFWDVAPCSLVENDRCFRGTYCSYHQGDEML
jgi:hypothetical protein